METVRPHAVAGLFYPADAAVLNSFIADQLEKNIPTQPTHTPKALIVPHAGYIYSGEVAAAAYQYLRPLHEVVKRVVIIGPSHRVPFAGLALSSADYFETTMGKVALDKVAMAELLDIQGINFLDQAHTYEHSLEVQLPFLQYLLDDFQIIPIIAGDASAALVAETINTLWGGCETLFIISSDLSHYLDYDSAQELDKNTSEAILNLDTKSIGPYHACGCIPINGLLTAAKQHALSGTMVDVRNSGDTAGKKNSVVGYGAYLFE